MKSGLVCKTVKVCYETKRVLDPKRLCHCGETNYTGYVQIYWFQPENNVLLMLIDNQLAGNGC